MKTGKRQFTLWVDGKLRTYDHPPEPPGYSYDQLLAMEAARIIDEHLKKGKVSK